MKFVLQTFSKKMKHIENSCNGEVEYYEYDSGYDYDGNWYGVDWYWRCDKCGETWCDYEEMTGEVDHEYDD